MSKNIIQSQQDISQKVGAVFSPSNPDSMIGIHLDGFLTIMPINGLRHSPEGVGNGWFIWCGGEIPQDSDFFQPMHIKHFIETYPTIAKYLGLPPGWRFQIDNKGYEDLWFDASLLET
jgi:hypothetical protein